jgi:hypothetical protein
MVIDEHGQITVHKLTRGQADAVRDALPMADWIVDGADKAEREYVFRAMDAVIQFRSTHSMKIKLDPKENGS